MLEFLVDVDLSVEVNSLLVDSFVQYFHSALLSCFLMGRQVDFTEAARSDFAWIKQQVV